MNLNESNREVRSTGRRSGWRRRERGIFNGPIIARARVSRKYHSVVELSHREPSFRDSYFSLSVDRPRGRTCIARIRQQVRGVSQRPVTSRVGVRDLPENGRDVRRLSYIGIDREKDRTRREPHRNLPNPTGNYQLIRPLSHNPFRNSSRAFERIPRYFSLTQTGSSLTYVSSLIRFNINTINML